jgi:acyl-CoA dehydrogenase
MDPRAKICILMGKTATTGPKYRQQSMILVPMDAAGVKIIRHLGIHSCTSPAFLPVICI